MNRVPSFLLILMLTVTASCGSSAPPPTRDGGSAVDETPAYWGLVDQTCWTYDDGSGQDLYTIAVNETMSVANVATYHLEFHYSGLPQREDYLQVVKNTLVDWYHVDYPANAPQVYWNYSPAPVLFAEGLGVGGSVMSMTQAMESTTSMGMTTNTTVPLSFVVTNADSQMVEVEAKMQSATQLIVTESQASGANATIDNYWFIPNIGIVQLQLSTQAMPFHLVKSASGVSDTDCVPG